jgi:16S rRNA (adenine1518-N6/adenine1519-N6)-dimethyltransferase
MPAFARKRLGQHFLHDPHVLAKLVDTIAPDPADVMVEIGGGHGALTRPLVEAVGRLHVIEIDSALAAELGEIGKTGGEGRAPVVHHADALRFDYSRLVTGRETLRVVGNLPYNISTPLLFHLLGFRRIIRDMHLMLQKEVVDRMTASPGGKDYGRLTVMLAAWTDIEHCFDVGPGAFSPPPRVRSSVVRIVPRTKASFDIGDEARFGRLVAHLFSMRRKTIGRSLRGIVPAAAIASAGIDPGARPETLEPSQFARLAGLGGDLA